MDIDADNGPGSIAIADIYGENNPGTAVANGDSNNVVILLNTGNGTSLSQITMATGPGSNYVEIADVNSDDKAGIMFRKPLLIFVIIWTMQNYDSTFSVKTNVTDL